MMTAISQRRSITQLNDRPRLTEAPAVTFCCMEGNAAAFAAAAAGRAPGFFCETRSVTPPMPISILLISFLQYGHESTCPGTASPVSTSSWQCGQFTKKLYRQFGQASEVSGTCSLQLGQS